MTVITVIRVVTIGVVGGGLMMAVNMGGGVMVRFVDSGDHGEGNHEDLTQKHNCKDNKNQRSVVFRKRTSVGFLSETYDIVTANNN